jgi:hypothetical protein
LLGALSLRCLSKRLVLVLAVLAKHAQQGRAMVVGREARPNPRACQLFRARPRASLTSYNTSCMCRNLWDHLLRRLRSAKVVVSGTLVLNGETREERNLLRLLLRLRSRISAFESI